MADLHRPSSWAILEMCTVREPTRYKLTVGYGNNYKLTAEIHDFFHRSLPVGDFVEVVTSDGSKYHCEYNREGLNTRSERAYLGYLNQLERAKNGQSIANENRRAESKQLTVVTLPFELFREEFPKPAPLEEERKSSDLNRSSYPQHQDLHTRPNDW